MTKAKKNSGSYSAMDQQKDHAAYDKARDEKIIARKMAYSAKESAVIGAQVPDPEHRAADNLIDAETNINHVRRDMKTDNGKGYKNLTHKNESKIQDAHLGVKGEGKRPSHFEGD